MKTDEPQPYCSHVVGGWVSKWVTFRDFLWSDQRLSADNINNVQQAFKNNVCMWFVARKCQEELI